MDREKEKNEVLIITGLSGAGKTQAANCLEDLGYFCVDNLPPALIPKFTELSKQSEGVKKVAFVVDVRGGQFFNDLFRTLTELEQDGTSHSILFLEASDEILIRRFKESRRKHPLSVGERITDAIKLEREMLGELRSQADLIIDTSNLNVHQLKEELVRIYSQEQEGFMTITVVSFGFKFGLPLDADLVFDVRFMANPKYVDELSHLTGEDSGVVDYVMEPRLTRSFLRRLINFMRFLLPNYTQEGKSHLVVGIGCTGGQHRSVVVANYLSGEVRKMGYRTLTKHRDLDKYKGNSK
ncbi:MAG: RNase adapter RapZ [Syntrophomonadaceae bacterium]|nr:RNase adapter RapZ [Syntrophomonadaceae bacterium]